jgi:hypothetical protein
MFNLIQKAYLISTKSYIFLVTKFKGY